MPSFLSDQPTARTRRGGSSPLLLALAAILLSGCSDPYSQKRIQRRWDHFNATAADISAREQDGYRRLDEADRSAQKWWRQNCERFERRAPTVGDYFW